MVGFQVSGPEANRLTVVTFILLKTMLKTDVGDKVWMAKYSC